MFLGPNGIQPFGYTRHSPLGPMFFQLRHLMTEEREYFREKFVESLMQAQFIVFDSLHVLDLNEDVLKYLDENFSTEPWECVGEYGKSDKYKFYYRNQ